MRRLALILASIALPAAETRQERGKRVVDEALKALGGERFLAMKDRVESGRVYSFYREQLAGLARATIYTRYLTPPVAPEPGKLYVRERQSFGKEEEYAVVFDEENGWQVTFRGARPVAEDMLLRYQQTTRRNVLYILRQRLGESGLILESQGTNVLDNQPVEVVDIIDSENLTTTVMFHYSTKLPLRQVFIRRDPKTKARFEEVTQFSKYRDAGGGVQWPMAIQRHRDGEKIFEIFSESVVVNQDLSDTLFTLPSDMKVLPRAR